MFVHDGQHKVQAAAQRADAPCDDAEGIAGVVRVPVSRDSGNINNSQRAGRRSQDGHGSWRGV